MTYYELISTLKELEKDSDNNELYQKLMNADITLYNDMVYRFAVQLMTFVVNKVNVELDKALDRLCTTAMDFETFSLTMKDLKNEIDYINTFTKIKILTEECQKDIADVIEKNIVYYDQIYIDVITKIYNEDYINEYKNIMNRKEVNNEL